MRLQPRSIRRSPCYIAALPAALPASLLLLLLLAAPGLGQGITDDEAEYLDVEVATIGVDLQSGAPLAILHANWERVVPIFIGDAEAQAIALARQGLPMPRPMTHDLLTSVIGTLGGTLEEVRVHDLRDNTYLGALRILVDDEIHEVDSRPSDALALAVRTGARIRVIPQLADSAPDVEFLSLEEDRAIARMRGITVGTPDAVDRTRFNLPEETNGVVVLHAMGVSTPRGVRPGDLILSVAGRGVDSALDFVEIVSERDRSSPVPAVVIRDGEEREIEISPQREPGRFS